MVKKIVFLIQPQTNLLDLGGATQVFLEAQNNGLQLDIQFCTFDNHITSGIGLPFGNLKNYNQVQFCEGDYLFVISTNIQYILSKQYNIANTLYRWFNEAHALGVHICAICNGAFLLGKVGLLDGRKCTTHWKRTKELRQLFPKAQVQENIIYIEDNGITTSAGGASGIDVSLHVLSKLKDDFFVHKISRELIVYQRRNGSDAQHSIFMEKRNHLHTGIHHVQDHIHSNIHKKFNLNELAEMANMSYRNFSRIFKRETNVTANQYINLVRKERISLLLQNPDLSRRQIANAVGLESERQLNRIMHDSTSFN